MSFALLKEQSMKELRTLSKAKMTFQKMKDMKTRIDTRHENTMALVAVDFITEIESRKTAQTTKQDLWDGMDSWVQELQVWEFTLAEDEDVPIYDLKKAADTVKDKEFILENYENFFVPPFVPKHVPGTAPSALWPHHYIYKGYTYIMRSDFDMKSPLTKENKLYDCFKDGVLMKPGNGFHYQEKALTDIIPHATEGIEEDEVLKAKRRYRADADTTAQTSVFDQINMGL